MAKGRIYRIFMIICNKLGSSSRLEHSPDVKSGERSIDVDFSASLQSLERTISRLNFPKDINY